MFKKMFLFASPLLLVAQALADNGTAVKGTASVNDVPSLTEWGVLLLGVGVVAVAAVRLYRRTRTA